jgi:hypothetical protein
MKVTARFLLKNLSAALRTKTETIVYNSSEILPETHGFWSFNLTA